MKQEKLHHWPPAWKTLTGKKMVEQDEEEVEFTKNEKGPAAN